MDPSTLEPVTVTCPRCEKTRDQRFYGPCAECVSELRATFDGIAREVEAEEYVPKMNVTPNAVASKE